jgi:hypothetical protein
VHGTDISTSAAQLFQIILKNEVASLTSFAMCSTIKVFALFSCDRLHFGTLIP